MLMIVIPFWKENAAQAETLVQWIYQLNSKVTSGSALLVAANDVHAEIRERIKVSAEMAFSNSEMIQLGKFEGSKNDHINWAFRNVSNYINRNYQAPFFWMEPDTTPTKTGWLFDIQKAYYGQPKKYAGSFMLNTLDGDKKFFLPRAITYPTTAFLDLANFCNGAKSSYNVEAGQALVDRASMHRLVQELLVNTADDANKVNQSAVAVHGDKNQILLKKLKAEQK